MSCDIKAIAALIKEECFRDGWTGNTYTGVGTQGEGSFDVDECEAILRKEFAQFLNPPEDCWYCRRGNYFLYLTTDTGKWMHKTAGEPVPCTARASQQEGKEE